MELGRAPGRRKIYAEGMKDFYPGFPLGLVDRADGSDGKT
jgi:hypothetical protein